MRFSDYLYNIYKSRFKGKCRKTFPQWIDGLKPSELMYYGDLFAKLMLIDHARANMPCRD